MDLPPLPNGMEVTLNQLFIYSKARDGGYPDTRISARGVIRGTGPSFRVEFFIDRQTLNKGTRIRIERATMNQPHPLEIGTQAEATALALALKAHCLSQVFGQVKGVIEQAMEAGSRTVALP